MSGQPFINIGEGRPRPFGTPVMYAPEAYAAWGREQYPPVMAQNAPVYAPSPFAPVFRDAPTPFVAPNEYALPYQPGEQQYGRPYQFEFLGEWYENYVKPAIPYVFLGGIALAAIYVLSRPKVRTTLTELATRGGSATRASVGTARDVARGAYRGFRAGGVGGLTPEEVEDIVQESRERKAMAKRESTRAKERARVAEMEAKRAAEEAEAHSETIDWLNGNGRGRRARASV